MDLPSDGAHSMHDLAALGGVSAAAATSSEAADLDHLHGDFSFDHDHGLDLLGGVDHGDGLAHPLSMPVYDPLHSGAHGSSRGGAHGGPPQSATSMRPLSAATVMIEDGDASEASATPGRRGSRGVAGPPSRKRKKSAYMPESTLGGADVEGCARLAWRSSFFNSALPLHSFSLLTPCSSFQSIHPPQAPSPRGAARPARTLTTSSHRTPETSFRPRVSASRGRSTIRRRGTASLTHR